MNNNFNLSIAPPAVSAVSAVWNELTPLTNTMTEQAPYPTECIGSVLAGALAELSATVQAPKPLIANSLLTAASLAVQAHADIKLIHGAKVPTTLFAITVGDSGERKSAIDNIALAPVKAYQIKLDTIYQLAWQSYRIDREAFDTAIKLAKSGGNGKGKPKPTREEIARAIEAVGAEPVPPMKPIILCSDPTVEGIFRQLNEGQPSIGLFTDEGGLFTSGYAMGAETKTATLARISKLWDGADFDRIRAGDGASLLRGRRMALHLMMQGIVANELFSDPIANGQGFLARCLVTYPQSTAGTRLFIDRDPMQAPAMKKYYARVLSILEQPPITAPNNEQQLEPKALEFSHAAKAMLIELHNAIEKQLDHTGTYAHVKALANKIAEHASRIAGVIHVIEHGTDAHVIHDAITGNAIKLAQWYLDEWVRISAAAMMPEHIRLAKTLHDWLLSDRNHNKPFVHTSQIAKYAPNALRGKAQYEVALNTLVEHGLCRLCEPMELDGKKRQIVYEVREASEQTAKTAKTATHPSENQIIQAPNDPVMMEAF